MHALLLWTTEMTLSVIILHLDTSACSSHLHHKALVVSSKHFAVDIETHNNGNMAKMHFRFVFFFISIEHLQRSHHHSVAAHCQLLRVLKTENIIVTSFNGVAYSSNYVNDFVMVMWERHSIPRHTHIHYHHFISLWLRFIHYFTFHRIKKKQTKCVPDVNVNDQPCTYTDGGPSGLPTDNVHAPIKLARVILTFDCEPRENFMKFTINNKFVILDESEE